jgi:hypothetical protein
MSNGSSGLFSSSSLFSQGKKTTVKRLKDLLRELDGVSGVPNELHSALIESTGVLTSDSDNWNEAILVYRGVPLAWANDPPLIRVYAWCLVHLGFAPFLPLDISKLVSDCKIESHEAKQALAQLVREGDLKVERVSRGRELYFLAPIRW